MPAPRCPHQRCTQQQGHGGFLLLQATGDSSVGSDKPQGCLDEAGVQIHTRLLDATTSKHKQAPRRVTLLIHMVLEPSCVLLSIPSSTATLHPPRGRGRGEEPPNPSKTPATLGYKAKGHQAGPGSPMAGRSRAGEDMPAMLHCACHCEVLLAQVMLAAEIKAVQRKETPQ